MADMRPRRQPPETEMLRIFVEARPRKDIGMSRDCLETETSRLRPQPWPSDIIVNFVIQFMHWCVVVVALRHIYCRLTDLFVSQLLRVSSVWLFITTVPHPISAGGHTNKNAVPWLIDTAKNAVPWLIDCWWIVATKQLNRLRCFTQSK